MYFKVRFVLYDEFLTEKCFFHNLAHRHLNHRLPLIHLHINSSLLKFICFNYFFLTWSHKAPYGMYEPFCCPGPHYRGHKNTFFLCPRDSAGEVVQNMVQKNCKRKTRVGTKNGKKWRKIVVWKTVHMCCQGKTEIGNKKGKTVKEFWKH